ncbi:50S ribosomal protein L11 methyltransferase [Halothiobacillus diazotrophicus]|uniref:50S ribosomal protein L11 methyltransferase n=1 Tax=Halothiobacillus diazotrophicus TaxID=1860122 RepID=UPI0009ED2F87|nr:50S ribosomal protein L11 methyltransferase [Halothiobacillus diazotrophicus]
MDDPAPRQWQRLSLDVPQADVESTEDALLAAGAVSVSLEELGDEPILEPGPGETPLWQKVRVAGLFEEGVSPAEIMAILHQHLRPALLGDFDYQVIEDTDWVRQTQADFAAACYGDGLWVVPHWETPPADAKAVVRIDPGLAFGTGQHGTTALCLGWLDRQALQGLNILDVGCGSGILALGALVKGAEMAWGTDIDPQALKASADNAQLNGIGTDRFSLGQPEELPVEARFDILIANILAQPLIDLAGELAPHLKPGGRFALSGILNHQAEAVAAQWMAQGLVIDAIDSLGDWSLVQGHRPH